MSRSHARTANPSATVLIVGCGDLGTEAGLRLAAAGHRVVGWRRSPEKLPAGIAGVAADLTRELPPVPPGTDLVVIAVAADGHDEDAYRAAYVGGVARVLEALSRDGVVPRRVLFVSSTAVYGSTSGDVDEQTPAEPTAFNGRVMREAELLLLSRLEGTPTAGIVLRLGGIYGPGRSRLIDQVRTGEARATTRRTTRIHRDDAATAVVHLISMADSPEQVYLGVDDAAATQAEVVRFLARELGAPEPQTAEASSNRGADRACSNARLRATGWQPTFPTYAEGYLEILSGAGIRHP
ncbi:NAD-dependent epimerase/dehydratase family protein [Nocardioides cavernaquae]|uniref:NAD-dependent epimerase/dehydratase family protein n=1 Tax=Nocardioides cavernaquae TaxID=2321396 RepID=A0A3A5H5N5_9ACTN|nr:NAD-dependent epimerase/dehydratase family protein [Nocardioides cavernaquae]RJS45989.1 NAD-dependent epimerase/dehydratase family protein [Nocardioides cavernaquae]